MPLLYKPATAGNKKKGSAGCSNGSMAGLNGATGSSTTTTASNGSVSAATSFLEFAGNSRYQAYNLARFSTLSAASSSVTSPTGSSRASADSRPPEKGHDAQEGPSSSSHASRAHSNPAESDTQSPLSPSMGSSLPPSSPSSIGALSGSSSSASAASASSKSQEDKDDDWAVNESYSGHGGQTYSPRAPSIPPPGTSSNTSSTLTSQDDRSDDEGNNDSRTKLQPSLSSFKSSSDIERSWRRTSDTLSPSSNSSASPTLSASLASKAGGLDLSSSTLVQQMLFRDRAPHSDDEAKNDEKQTDNEGNHTKDSARMRKDDAHHDKRNKHQEERTDYGDHFTERRREDLNQGQAAKDKSAADEAASNSPSLASMLLGSTTTVPPLSSSTDEAAPEKPNKTSSRSVQDKTEQQEEDDHISKLDIRVGIVRSVLGHPDADSLYIEQVDVGDKKGDQAKEARTIVSGLVRHVPKEYLEGRAVIVVANMKPSKLRGVMSQGMLLCAMEQDASGEVTKVALLEPAEGSEAGDKVTFEGFTNEDTVPAAVLTPKRKWFEKSRVHFSVQDGVAYYKGSPFRTVKGLVRSPSLCLNPDAITDLAPVQPTKDNLLPASFPTLAWSETSAAAERAAKTGKRLCYRHRPDLRSKRAADEIQLDELQQVCKSWKRLADDDVVWHRMCEQHIGLKCTKCGWGLPLLEKKKPPAKPEGTTKRLWKDIYSERLIVERNWRKRNYRLKEFRGHTDGVMCLQFDDSFLITGSYDNTAKVWNIETGECLRTLKGHALCVRALHFDEAKLITGSMDRTLKIWNYHTGQCIRTLQGHTDGVVTLDFDSRILASGSADATIKTWNFATGECSTLKGHTDLVNKVQIYKKTLLFSASDDTTVKLWDIASRTCLRTFTGHVGRVQCLQTSGDALISILANRMHSRLAQRQGARSTAGNRGQRSPAYEGASSSDGETVRNMLPIVISGGLDNTLKVWNAESGECLNTLFGHEDGVWSLAFDKLRIVSGGLDKTVKVWDTESGECLYSLHGPDGPVTCVGLGDTRIAGGAADGAVFVWDYGV
ncbi:hypothetical protein BGZ70_006981 [Mortierella alpina]|uniref:tRNA-binding domain-containing protein n=1 Tax=Mortierella alpina TaxID=64518 RepID=A0A9P6M3E6_MORAP|nr:hypothetical protein BGZ70_006981 [Mortierella alpina]